MLHYWNYQVKQKLFRLCRKIILKKLIVHYPLHSDKGKEIESLNSIKDFAFIVLIIQLRKKVGEVVVHVVLNFLMQLLLLQW